MANARHHHEPGPIDGRRGCLATLNPEQGVGISMHDQGGSSHIGQSSTAVARRQHGSLLTHPSGGVVRPLIAASANFA
jgi:hypothetical protein